MKKVLFRIFIFIVIVIIIVNLLSMFNLSFFGFRTFRIGSGSMDPYLKINDFILIKEKSEYKVNDVVTYMNDTDSYVTHRIISIDEDEVITKGDANNIQDTPITKDSIVGKVVFRLRGFGFIMYLFSSYTSWILLFIIGLGVTMIIPDKKENDEERRDSDAKESSKEDSEESFYSEEDNIKKRSSKKENSAKEKSSSKTRSTTRSKSSSTKTKTKIKKEVYCIPFFVCAILHYVL